jgi:hypothetical protein
MEWEGKIVSPQFRCAATGQALAVGTEFFSGLRFQNGIFQRQDFAAAAWAGVDRSGFVSWWRRRVPVPGAQARAFRLDAGTLLQIFANLKDSRLRALQCLAYVVALGLVRARKLRVVESGRHDGRGFLVLEDRAQGAVFRIRDVEMKEEEERRVLDDLLTAVAGPALSEA